MDQTTIIIIATVSSVLLILLIILLIFILRRRYRKAASRSYVHLEDSSGFATKHKQSSVRVIEREEPAVGGGEESEEEDDLEAVSGPAGPDLPSAYQNLEDSVLPSYVAVEDFEPRRRDDMRLRVGDRITISMGTPTPGTPSAQPTATPHGTDATPTTPSASQTSYFPPQPPADATQTTTPQQQTGQKSKLLFSMVPVDQALEIVTSSLSASRRAEYFETLLRQQTHRSTSSVSSSTGPFSPTSPHPQSPLDSPLMSPEVDQALRASMEGAAGGETRGKQAWRKLRVGWKDAVKNELQEGYRKWVEDREKFDIWGFMAENYRVDGGGSLGLGE
ncbi:hypothetical protein HDV00_006024 [Rhizophlyctis rosea]|nr:hypothetical protein HDV00_006024 [Rhizophlyctis rosea]